MATGVDFSGIAKSCDIGRRFHFLVCICEFLCLVLKELRLFNLLFNLYEMVFIYLYIKRTRQISQYQNQNQTKAPKKTKTRGNPKTGGAHPNAHHATAPKKPKRDSLLSRTIFFQRPRAFYIPANKREHPEDMWAGLRAYESYQVPHGAAATPIPAKNNSWEKANAPRRCGERAYQSTSAGASHWTA